ncbi:class I SAM-dependent methyltransferase [Candidatus Micrarchaeota archaeon]|nr:class I SAM-dependent methyltransferase [Candidatus Micrarchaeota archaeon]
MKLIKRTRSAAWWRAWRDFERGSRKWQRGVELPTIAALCKFSKSKDALEVGAGSGRLASKFAAKCRMLCAIEHDEKALATLRKDKQVKVVDADLHALPFADESFDCVYSAWVLQSRRLELPTAVAEQARVLKKKGRLVAVIENEEGDDAELMELLGKKSHDKRKRRKIVTDIKKLLHANGCRKVEEERKRVCFEFHYPVERTAEILRQIIISGEKLNESQQSKLRKFLEKRRKKGKVIFTQGASFISAEK